MLCRSDAMSQHKQFYRHPAADCGSRLGRAWSSSAYCWIYRGQGRCYAGDKRNHGTAAQTQKGAALITSLIFLTVLTILGMSTLGTALLESRMAGNARDRNTAFQAAEMGLRDAELFIRNSGRIAENILLESSLDEYKDYTGQTCTYGFCYNGPTWQTAGKDWVTNPVWKTESNWANAIQYWREGATGKAVGRGSIQLSFDAAAYQLPARLPLVSRQPEYLIESYAKKADGNYYYRITVRGYGVRPGTRVMVQEIYTP